MPRKSLLTVSIAIAVGIALQSTSAAAQLRDESGDEGSESLSGSSQQAQPAELVRGEAYGSGSEKNVPVTTEAATLGAVQVTARKRTESIQNVPIAITSVSKEELENNIATDLSKVGELAPQVMIGRHVAGTGAVLTIRGISSSATDAGLDQSVSVSIDGVPMSRGRVVSSSIFDMQQIEVLAGPQALFFGKNSPAGVISMRSADPSDYFEASLKGGYEFNADERFVEGVVSGPITSTLKARLAFRGNWMDGWIKNNAEPLASPFQPGATLPGALQGRTGPDGHDAAGRFTLVWTPSEDFDANLKLLVNEQKLNSGAGYAEGFCIGDTTVPVHLGVPMPGADCLRDWNRAESAQVPEFAVNHPYGNGGIPYMDVKIDFASLALNKRFNDVELSSTTGYYNQVVSDSFSADYSPFTQIYSAEHEKYRLVSQEFRASTYFDRPVNFMGGIYLERADRYWYNAPNVSNVFNPETQSYVTNEQNTDSESKGYSVFGQVLWNIVPSLELAIGARYSRDEKEASFVNVVNNMSSGLGATLYPQGQILASRYKDDNVSPEATLRWSPSAGQTVYGGYKTGYKSGGFSNTPFLRRTATAESVRFGPEEARGFEVGYKANLLQNTLHLDLAAYSYGYHGLQVTHSNSQTLEFTVGNAAKVRTEGLTAAFKWLATDNLSLDGNVGYNRARYLSFPSAQCYPGQTAAQGCENGVQDLSGKTLNRAPETVFQLGGDYRIDLVAGWTADLSINGAYTSSYQTAPDYNPCGYQADYWRLNAAAHITPSNQKFRFSLIGRNLTNAYTLVSTSGWPGTGNFDQCLGVSNRPREVVLQAEYRF